jgi:predicted nicotinamide N-methyase
VGNKTIIFICLLQKMDSPDLLLPSLPAGFECGETTAIKARSGVGVDGVAIDTKLEDSYGEDDDVDDDLPVTFYCTVPIIGNEDEDDNHDADGNISSGRKQRTKTSTTTLYFGCRRPSFGVLTSNEDRLQEGEYDASSVDRNMFDKGYTLAGSTGFCVWAGARFIVEALVVHTDMCKVINNNNTRDPLDPLGRWHNCIRNGGRVLELGSGVGFLGISLAWAGAEVLLTDLPTLVHNAIRPNLQRNSKLFSQQHQRQHKQQNQEETPPLLSGDGVVPPLWLTSNIRKSISHNSCSTDGYIEETSSTMLEEPAYRIGRGWASTTPLDWSVHVMEQLSRTQLNSIDVIVASDCAWLASMLDMLLDTVEALFDAKAGQRNVDNDDDDDDDDDIGNNNHGPPSFLMAFQRRDRNIGSATFTTMDTLSDAVTKRGWTLQSRAWRPITLVDGTKTSVFLVEILSKALSS